MQDPEVLYAELKPVIEAIATPLIEFSKQCLRDRGAFLPHGAVLTAEGKIALVAAQTERDLTNSVEVLPLLQGGLRALIKQERHAAVGIAENVSVALPGQSRTDAIKVLFEHQRGLAVALYVPFVKKFMRGYVFGDMISMLAAPEVNAWGSFAT